MKTQIIATRRITLTPGKRYRVSRPIAKRGTSSYQVIIADLINDEVPLIVPGLTYIQANDFINEFNNGSTSFAGQVRVW